MLARLVFLLSLFLLVPAHGAEPELPSGLPSASADEKRAVLELMKQNKEKYGADAALLQGLLLTHSLQGEAVLTSESTITGFEQSEDKKYVAFRLATGVVLNDKLLDRDRRLERMWHVVLERALRHYPSFTAPADGLAIEMHYNHRPYDRIAELYDENGDGAVERAKFYLSAADLSEFLAHRLGAQDFLDRSRIVLDDHSVKLRLTEASMPPRPPAEAMRAGGSVTR